MLPSVTEVLLDRAVDNLLTEGYEWNEYLCNMSQAEIDCDPEDYSRSVKALAELHDYIQYLEEWI